MGFGQSGCKNTKMNIISLSKKSWSILESFKMKNNCFEENQEGIKKQQKRLEAFFFETLAMVSLKSLIKKLQSLYLYKVELYRTESHWTCHLAVIW